jgi:predicted SpoU family rRNA methylase
MIEITQSIIKEYNGQTYTTGETWKSTIPYPYTLSGVIVGFTQKGKPLIELDSGCIETLNNPDWVKVKKTKYYIYRGYDGNLAITNQEISESLHEFTLEE